MTFTEKTKTMDHIYFIVLMAFTGVISGTLTEEKYTKFEYEYKVLERIVELEHDHKDMKKLTTKISQLEDFNHETAKILESQAETVSHLTGTVKQQEEYIKELTRSHESDIDEVKKHLESAGDSAATYTRWGRNDCPNNGTVLVYDGFVGGSWYNTHGGGSNYVCLTKTPSWGHIQSGNQDQASMFGAEYEFSAHTSNGKDFFGKDLHNYKAPCAVCRTTRPTVIMIPGTNKCLDGWTLEYYGYLAASHKGHKKSTEFTCIDKSPASVPQAKSGGQDGALFYLVEGNCGSLKCPPYINYAELTCVVCSK